MTSTMLVEQLTNAINHTKGIFRDYMDRILQLEAIPITGVIQKYLII